MFCEQLESRQLLSASPAAHPSYSIGDLLGHYQGALTVKLGGVKASIAVDVDFIPINKNTIEVEGEVAGIYFDEKMFGSVKKNGNFDFSRLTNGGTTFAEFDGCITTVKGVQLITGSATVSDVIYDQAQITVTGKYQLDQIFNLA